MMKKIKPEKIFNTPKLQKWVEDNVQFKESESSAYVLCQCFVCIENGSIPSSIIFEKTSRECAIHFNFSDKKEWNEIMVKHIDKFHKDDYNIE